jgi:hypothetical protein
MAHYGPMWPQIPALQGFLQPYCGEVRSAMVYGLWFTRERSKVRSLVRPPAGPSKLAQYLVEQIDLSDVKFPEPCMKRSVARPCNSARFDKSLSASAFEGRSVARAFQAFHDVRLCLVVAPIGRTSIDSGFALTRAPE